MTNKTKQKSKPLTGSTALVVFLTACTTPPPAVVALPVPSTPAGSPEQRVGSVTVAIVVDQLAAWIARDRLALLESKSGALATRPGGFARLRAEGTWYTDVRFAHAITETAVGHASLFTGASPREHGVVSNEVRVAHAEREILFDNDVRLVTAAGVIDQPSSSAKAIQSELVADRFKAAQPEAKVFAFSLKDRAAIAGGGRDADLNLWYDASRAQFVTSTAFAQALPAWVAAATGPTVIEKELDKPWSLLDAAWVAAHALTPDDAPGEADFFGFGTVFPHRARDSKKPLAAYRALPSTDKFLLDLAIRALDQCPRQAPVLLAISLSANDYIGHLFGPDSYESWDELRRLDIALGEFFAELDRQRGPQNWSVVLSADHGVIPLPEVNRRLANFEPSRVNGARPREISARVMDDDLARVARVAAEKALGKGDWIESVTHPYVYLSDKAKQLPVESREQLQRALTAAFSASLGVARLFDVSALPTKCPSYEDESLDALVCRSVHPGIGGDYFVALVPGYFFDTGYVPGKGTSHGSAALHDRSVPILARLPTKVAAGSVVDAPQVFTLYERLLRQALALPTDAVR